MSITVEYLTVGRRENSQDSYLLMRLLSTIVYIVWQQRQKMRRYRSALRLRKNGA
jgi:hypothetical protein